MTTVKLMPFFDLIKKNSGIDQVQLRKSLDPHQTLIVQGTLSPVNLIAFLRKK